MYIFTMYSNDLFFTQMEKEIVFIAGMNRGLFSKVKDLFE